MRLTIACIFADILKIRNQAMVRNAAYFGVVNGAALTIFMLLCRIPATLHHLTRKG